MIQIVPQLKPVFFIDGFGWRHAFANAPGSLPERRQVCHASKGGQAFVHQGLLPLAPRVGEGVVAHGASVFVIGGSGEPLPLGVVLPTGLLAFLPRCCWLSFATWAESSSSRSSSRF